MQALNNALGRPFCSDDDMDVAVTEFLARCRRDGRFVIRAAHAKPTGWFSDEVLAEALNLVSMMKAGRIEYKMELEPLHKNPQMIHSAIGAIVNYKNQERFCRAF